MNNLVGRTLKCKRDNSLYLILKVNKCIKNTEMEILVLYEADKNQPYKAGQKITFFWAPPRENWCFLSETGEENE